MGHFLLNSVYCPLSKITGLSWTFLKHCQVKVYNITKLITLSFIFYKTNILHCKLPNKYTSILKIVVLMPTVIITTLLTENSRFLNNYFINLVWLVFLINLNKIRLFLIHGHFSQKNKNEREREKGKEGGRKGRERKRREDKGKSIYVFNKYLIVACYVSGEMQGIHWLTKTDKVPIIVKFTV